MKAKPPYRLGYDPIELPELLGSRHPHETAPEISERMGSMRQTIAELLRDELELAERVMAGELTPDAVTRQKGWRKARIVVSLPERTAESLRKHMPAEARLALARLLLNEQENPESRQRSLASPGRGRRYVGSRRLRPHLDHQAPVR